MKRVIGRVQDPVRREGADINLLLTLLSFAASVSITRLFLEVTGYPQLGGGELHIAHVLWGGLLLFAASLIPLVYANRWVYRWGAVLAGVGMGLFIDEVGKFITATNDYFHPAAAPIIYAFFLVTVLIYRRVRRPPLRSARSELYRALDAMEELLDHDLEPAERADLTRRLKFVRDESRHPNFRLLASQLLSFLEHEDLGLAPKRMSRLDRALRWIQAWEARHITEGRARAMLVGGLLGLGAWALFSVIQVLSPELVVPRLETLIQGGVLANEVQLAWFTARVALELAVGSLLVIAGGMLLVGRSERGQWLGYLAVVLSLTTVNVLAFYFEQFSTIVKAAVEFALLLGLLRYRSLFIVDDQG
ncbi:MAG: hypothetical protein R3191_02625 [Anaerolineales bacterium]|nr:hypothetical protein [Anaerolineales bacterium]